MVTKYIAMKYGVVRTSQWHGALGVFVLNWLARKEQSDMRKFYPLAMALYS
jgi:hypothetical protein